jgi:uncharacterized membrane protein (DUF4010 family)
MRSWIASSTQPRDRAARRFDAKAPREASPIGIVGAARKHPNAGIVVTLTIAELKILSWEQLPATAESLTIGSLIGLERQKTHKILGMRTFGAVAVVSTLAWWLAPQAAYGVLGLCVALTTALNVRSFLLDGSLELTTSVAMLATALLGILIAQQQLLPAGLCGLIILGLLAWKEELGGFAQAVTVAEIRGALRLGVIWLVVYPLLPAGAIDPWGLVNLRDAWIAVVAISGIGFFNYIILRVWGARGIGWTGLLGGFVNSRAVAVELAQQARSDPARFTPFTIFGILTANATMIVRNTLLLALFAPHALRWGWPALGCMFLASVVLAALYRVGAAARISLHLESPVALKPVLTFGFVFLVIGTAGEIAQRVLGHVGVLMVTLLGGLVSSASSVVAVATLAGHGAVQPATAAYAVVLASMTTLFSNVPAVQIAGKNRACSIRIAVLSGAIVLAGVAGLLVGLML